MIIDHIIGNKQPNSSAQKGRGRGGFKLTAGEIVARRAATIAIR